MNNLYYNKVIVISLFYYLILLLEIIIIFIYNKNILCKLNNKEEIEIISKISVFLLIFLFIELK